MTTEHTPGPSSPVGADDYGPCVEADIASDSDELYFFFGGISGNLAVPRFEFYKASGVLDCKKVFIRDLSQSWYHGPGGTHRTVGEMRELIETLIDRAGARRVTFVGNSMGGFAAILFASLTGKGRALAFAPQTFVSPRLKFGHGDLRWKSQTLRVWRRGLSGQRFWDLRPVVGKAPDAVRIDIFVSRDDRLDMAHANHLAADPKVTLHHVEGGGHRLVSVLRDQGRLKEILRG